MWMPRAAQRTVQTQIEVSDHIAIENDGHVVVGILQRVIRGTEKQQQRVDKHQSEHTHQDADDDIERHQIAQHPFCCLVVLLSQLNRHHRRTAHTHHRTESGTQVHDGEGDRQATQRQRAHIGNVSDEDAIDHIVER